MDWIDDQQKLWRAGMDRDEITKCIAEMKAALQPFGDVVREMRSRGIDPTRGNYINADVEAAAYVEAERLTQR